MGRKSAVVVCIVIVIGLLGAVILWKMHRGGAAAPASSKSGASAEGAAAQRTDGSSGAATQSASAKGDVPAQDLGDVEGLVHDSERKDVPAIASEVPAGEIEKAKDMYEEQHRSWLAVRTVAGRFSASEEGFVKGETINRKYSGDVEILVTPLDKIEHYHLDKISVRVTIDQLGLTFYDDNIYDDVPAQVVSRTGERKSASDPAVAYVYNNLFIPLWFRPLAMMRDSYSDSGDPRRYTKKEFYEGVGTPRRLSTEDENKELFSGGPQYLFIPYAHKLTDARYWLSKDRGVLDRIDDGYSEGTRLADVEFGNYVGEESGPARFPTRLVRNARAKMSAQVKEEQFYRMSVDLSDAKINGAIAEARFKP